MNHFFIALIGGIFGCIVGSFLNVVILRMHTGKGLGGRSQCFSCNKTLAWYELIPVVSFVIQRGKCASCRSSISWQYPLVEIITGLLFFGAFLSMGYRTALLPWLIMISLGVIISVYDIHHKVISLNHLIAFAIVGVFLGSVYPLGVSIAIPFIIVYYFSQGRWIGFGDIQIMVIIGLLFGVISGLSIIMVAFWVASAVMIPVVLLAKYRNKKLHHEIPFGPFLFIAIYLVEIGGLDVLRLLIKMLY